MSYDSDPHVAYDAPTGILMVDWRHMAVHGQVEDVERFAALILRAVRDRRQADERLCPQDFLHVLEEQGI